MLKLIHMVKKPCSALLKYFCIPGFLHAVDKSINLFFFNSCKIIAYGNIKLEAVCSSKTKLLCHYMKNKPCFNIFSHSLRHIELCGPLAVIAFVLCQDTRTVNAGCQLIAVHFLNSFQLKESCSCIIGSHNILSQLCVGACCRADGSLKISSENLHILCRICLISPVYAKYSSFFLMFC